MYTTKQTRKKRSVNGLAALRLFTLLIIVGAAGLFSACSSNDTKTDTKTNATAKTDAIAVSETVAPTDTIWTCSMHPQIRMHEPGNCPICGMTLIPAGNDDGGVDDRSIKLSETARKLASVQVTPVQRHVITREVRMVGLVEYDETRLRNINAWFPGRLDKLFVNFTGVTVEKGEPMAEIYSPDLLSAQEELLQAIKSRDDLKNSKIGVVRRSADATIDAARDKLRLWGITDQQIENIEQTGVTSDHVTVYAPVEGVVIKRNASEGDYVKDGSKILTLADLSTVWLSLDAYESDINYLRLNQEVTFTTNTYPGETFVGKITFIDPTLNPKSRTVRARVEVNNEDGRLKPGMFAHGIAYSDLEAPDAGIPLVIPASAPLITGKRAVVYVQDPDEPGMFSGRVVTLGARGSDKYIVKEGLGEGELVVTNGAFKIDAAMQIQAKPSMMYASGGAPMSGHAGMNMGGSSSSQGSEHDSMKSMKQDKSASGETTATPKATMKAPKNVGPAFSGYLDLQEALRTDDLPTAKKVAGNLVATFETYCADSISAKGQTLFDSLSRAGLDLSTEISKSSDIAAARAQFAALTSTMLSYADSYGMGDVNRAYKFFCPMANGGEGAPWLQRDDNKQNPYFGTAMPKCGVFKGIVGDTATSDAKPMDMKQMNNMNNSPDSMEHRGH